MTLSINNKAPLHKKQNSGYNPLVTNMKRTKIIATIGPATETPEAMQTIMESGVNIFRFNMKHNTVDWHAEKINLSLSVAKEIGHTLGILIDLQGPEIRVQTPTGNPIDVITDEVIPMFPYSFDFSSVEETKYLRCPDPVVQALNVGDAFVLDDGYVQFSIIDTNEDGHLMAQASNEHTIKTNRSLNLVQKDINLPSITEKDVANLAVTEQAHVDFVALSFVRSKEDIAQLRATLDERNIDARIVSKVESQKGEDNIDEIIDASDVLMIARGDLGIETSLESVTYFQKKAIEKCRAKCTPVIVATQMLESMIKNPLPTRAEAADVANAVFDRTDCVMLSGETAFGAYALKTVEQMNTILAYNEQHVGQSTFRFSKEDGIGQTLLIVNAAAEILASKKVTKAIVLTETGYTARALASIRPQVPILAISNASKKIHDLTASFNVTSLTHDYPENTPIAFSDILEDLREKGHIETGEVVLMVHGQRRGVPGRTNALALFTV